MSLDWRVVQVLEAMEQDGRIPEPEEIPYWEDQIAWTQK